jgi:hypothetical protein
MNHEQMKKTLLYGGGSFYSGYRRQDGGSIFSAFQKFGMPFLKFMSPHLKSVARGTFEDVQSGAPVLPSLKANLKKTFKGKGRKKRCLKRR